jgi:hypothetical protein
MGNGTVIGKRVEVLGNNLNYWRKELDHRVQGVQDKLTLVEHQIGEQVDQWQSADNAISGQIFYPLTKYF